MAKGGLQFWHLLIIVLLAALVGTAVSELLAKTFPEGVVGRFFAAGVTIGSSSPWDLDLSVLHLTLGATVRLTALGALSAGAAGILFIRRL